jgi:hypothetical protein
MQAPATRARAQDALHVGAVHATKWRAKILAVGVAQSHRMSRDSFAGAAVPVDELSRLGCKGKDLVQKPQTRQLARTVCGEFVRLLEDVGRDASLGERNRQGEAADAGADDRDAHFYWTGRDAPACAVRLRPR